MFKTIHGTEHSELFRTVLCAIVRNQLFWHAMVVEDPFSMVDDRVRADVVEFSCDRKLAVVISS